MIYFCPNIAFTIEMLCRYLQNPWIAHLKDATKVLGYLQCTQYVINNYRRNNELQMWDTQIQNLWAIELD